MPYNKRGTYRRFAFLLLAVVLLAAMATACGKGKNEESESGASPSASASATASIDPDTVLATYDGGELKQAEFSKYEAFMNVTNPQMAMYLSIPQYKEEIIKQYILQKAFAERATDEQKKAGKTQSEEFKKQLDEALKDETNGASLKDAMKTNNITEDELVDLVVTLATGGEISSAKENEIKATVKDADIKAEYDKAPADYNIDTVRHILVSFTDPTTNAERSDADALKRAQEVKKKLEEGGDWTALAKEYSDDTGSKETGGLYDKTQAKTWVAEFKDAANKQAIGVIGEPVKTEYGYHVIKVEARQETPYDKLAQADKDAIVTALIDPKMQTFIQEETDKLKIKVTLPAEPSPSPSASGSAAPSASASASASAPASPSASASASASSK
ncbi:peptidylprolyl isomerase [Cohnella sp. JJ-181]|uniref:peptidylprolyl isomerase n=1 Tax=Cohnella rhizoplanae TaxID=2974897 RepID=UPI0022FF52EE|nr:peptidylprolyl isomerase [Cohnella sp. JJ-181]CAI6084751.1 Foldase protein PrsA [Cohnella sp. JJ-181]